MKKQNEYQKIITPKLYESTPKAVFAAIVVSEYTNRLEIKPEDIDEAILKEWEILHAAGIVPQKPPKYHG